MGVRSVAEIRRLHYDRPGDPPKWVRGVLERAWFVLVPLFAGIWFEAKQIEPRIKELATQLEQQRKTADNARTEVLKQATQIKTRVSALSALADTFEVRFQQVDAVLDSIRTLQSADRAERLATEHEIDSLRTVYSLSEGDKLKKSSRLALLQNRVDSLRAVITTREAETAQLEAQIEQSRDLRDRVLHPDKYRETDALVRGAGSFPDRDALPKRK